MSDIDFEEDNLPSKDIEEYNFVEDEDDVENEIEEYNENDMYNDWDFVHNINTQLQQYIANTSLPLAENLTDYILYNFISDIAKEQ